MSECLLPSTLGEASNLDFLAPLPASTVWVTTTAQLLCLPWASQLLLGQVQLSLPNALMPVVLVTFAFDHNLSINHTLVWVTLTSDSCTRLT